MVGFLGSTAGYAGRVTARWLVDSEMLGHGMDAYDPEHEQDKRDRADEREYDGNEPSEAQGR
jgi:hypothetical protein